MRRKLRVLAQRCGIGTIALFDRLVKRAALAADC
jgi:hypothetical protein